MTAVRNGWPESMANMLMSGEQVRMLVAGELSNPFLAGSRCVRISALADSNGANPTSDNGSPDSLGEAPLRLYAICWRIIQSGARARIRWRASGNNA